MRGTYLSSAQYFAFEKEKRGKSKKELIEKVILTDSSGYTYYVVHMARKVNCKHPGEEAVSFLLIFSLSLPCQS